MPVNIRREAGDLSILSGIPVNALNVAYVISSVLKDVFTRLKGATSKQTFIIARGAGFVLGSVGQGQ